MLRLCQCSNILAGLGAGLALVSPFGLARYASHAAVGRRPTAARPTNPLRLDAAAARAFEKRRAALPADFKISTRRAARSSAGQQNGRRHGRRRAPTTSYGSSRCPGTRGAAGAPLTKKQKQARTLAARPWVEKYRPASLDELVAHKEIVGVLRRLIKNDKLPHTLLYGPPGTGKTSTI